LLRRYLRTIPKLREQIDDPTEASAFTRLKDKNVLYEIFPQQEVKFTHDRFFEYLLAQNILLEPFDSERCLDLIKEAEKFGSLRGAIETALILGKRKDIIRELATKDIYAVRSVLIGALASLAVQDPETMFSFMKDLLTADSIAAKRLTVLASVEIRPVPVDILEEAMKDKNPSVRRLAVQCAYLIWTRNHKEGEDVARRIASVGLRDLARPSLETSFELQERIFLNHFKDPDAVRLVDSLGMERLRTSRLLSLAKKKPILYIGIELTQRMYTTLWGWRYEDGVYPVFSVSEEYREAARAVLPYLDPSQRLPEEVKKNLYDVATGPFAGVASLILIYQLQANPNNILPLVRELMKSNEDRRVLTGMQALAFGSRVLDGLEQDLELARETIYQNPSYRHRLLDFGMNLSARRPGEIGFITSVMKRAKDERNIGALIDSILELGNIGIRFPENSLLTLEVAIDDPHVEVREALIQTLSKIRVFYPDKVDNYLWNRRLELLGKIPFLELERVPVEIFSVVDFVQYLFQKMPRMRAVLIEMLERYIDMKSQADFRKLLRFCIRKSIDTWLDRKVMEEYLRFVEEDAMVRPGQGR
nr:hypothetical protein [Candidatus Njordarchaeum guaymaensis]